MTSTLLRTSAVSAVLLSAGVGAVLATAAPAQAAVLDVRVQITNETTAPLEVTHNAQTIRLAPHQSTTYASERSMKLNLTSPGKPTATVNATNPYLGAPEFTWTKSGNEGRAKFPVTPGVRRVPLCGSSLSEGETAFGQHPKGYLLQMSRTSDTQYKELQLVVR